MWNLPNQNRLDLIPRLYETEHIPLKDKLVHLHMFLGGCEFVMFFSISSLDGFPVLRRQMRTSPSLLSFWCVQVFLFLFLFLYVLTRFEILWNMEIA